MFFLTLSLSSFFFFSLFQYSMLSPLPHCLYSPFPWPPTLRTAQMVMLASSLVGESAQNPALHRISEWNNWVQILALPSMLRGHEQVTYLLQASSRRLILPISGG